MAKKIAKNRPKWKSIQDQLKNQGAFSEQAQDGDAFIVFGDFNSISIQAFTDRFRFSQRRGPIFCFFKENMRIKEDLRFGKNDILLFDFEENKFSYKGYSHRYSNEKDEYIAIIAKRNDLGAGRWNQDRFFYVDRVI